MEVTSQACIQEMTLKENDSIHLDYIKSILSMRNKDHA